MRIAKGPRPWSIRISCALLLLLACWTLWIHLRDTRTLQGLRIEQFPQVPWSEDFAIVSAFTEFTIALIPIVLIAIYAKRFARVLVSVFTVIKVALIGMTLWSYYEQIGRFFAELLWEPALLLLCVALLYLPSASRWFKGQDALDETVFQ
ncbi:hypothetical protein INR77_01350 [Erythrobacter sp. SCSIO 43205]|uniref:hypothetical protein n=1 Tax=Erythrobacter sp. SCSIO 43205 TaxID=2779361 RepID=UPI001CA9652E|nr:hypothetical protein [Erythrobacter sp. SCSIO 43205]UAB78419.1 hypothetical protein INR77_01350 [Erythrobacter sp. SCSIO 43205]